jgi:hypothetical protein
MEIAVQPVEDAEAVRPHSGSLLETPYVDPLQDVLTASRNGSQIWLSNADQRRLSVVNDPESENGLGSPIPTVKVVRRKSRLEEALPEWKSLGPSQSQNVDQLFGLEELNKHLPHHRLRIFVGTWNVNGQGSVFQNNPLNFRYAVSC